MSTPTLFKEYKEFTWSIMSTKPLTVYVDQLDMHVTFIEGIALPREVAVNLISNYLFDISPCSSVKVALQQSYERFRALSGLAGNNDTKNDFSVIQTKVYNFCNKNYPKPNDIKLDVFEWCGYKKIT